MFDQLWDESPRVQRMKKQFLEQGRKEAELAIAKRLQEADQERLRLQREAEQARKEAEQERVRAQREAEQARKEAEQEIEKARADQEVKALRNSLVSVIRARFPSLTKFARQQVELFDNPEVLDLLIQQTVAASDANTVRLLLNPSVETYE